ncbi:hypothetical protein MNBD_ALPHA06-1019 [hydrothermal vent metagenome]|uniref:Toxin n=1 Tax=hydrothermal vent metagenome TaxID=652676 RepID=A0A3B0S0D0_9ZZZZ
MKALQLSCRAKTDLANIWDYTAAEFGTKQADAYLSALEDGFSLLLDNPKIGKLANHIAHGYRTFAKGQHHIYYHLNKESIAIIAVLHERMEVKEAF